MTPSGGNTTVRVVSVQLAAGPACFGPALYDRLDYFVAAAADYDADFVVFPELFTCCLIASSEGVAADAVPRTLSQHTEAFVERMRTLAVSKAVNIIAGSHLLIDETGVARNRCHVLLRDGSVHRRDKLHPTPSERSVWNVAGGDSCDVIETDCGPMGVLICYDSEFPEQARHLADQGALICFVPYCTDTAHGHWRVRHCCQARAIENQCYMVTSGLTGHVEGVPDMAGSFARSAVLTPCDIPFDRDGIAAEASENVDMMIVADLNLDTLRAARATGSVRNLADRRTDLYSVTWKGR